MSLDATVGGASANAYVTQAAADTFFTNRLDAADWTDATSAQKDAAIIMATLRLDTELYVGAPVFSDQRLKWPRYGAFDADDRLLAQDAIPLMVEQATCEYALALVKEPSLLSDSGLEGFAHVQVGSLSITPRAIAAGQLPAIVKRLIAPVRLGGTGTPVRRA